MSNCRECMRPLQKNESVKTFPQTSLVLRAGSIISATGTPCGGAEKLQFARVRLNSPKRMFAHSKKKNSTVCVVSRCKGFGFFFYFVRSCNGEGLVPLFQRNFEVVANLGAGLACAQHRKQLLVQRGPATQWISKK